MLNHPYFLLGGHDLEMETIASLLRQHRVAFSDASLRWNNAVLSRYAAELSHYPPSSGRTLYGVELREDIPAPSNYVRIDHHNDAAGRPSALEQVAALLSHPLDRYLRLVAANDAAYIPGMQALGATADEVTRIRQADRRAQGVTDEDERLAEASIAGGLHRDGDLLWVEARTSRFSPICDRLFPYRRLLIYTDRELMYYGRGVSALALHFAAEVKAGRMFHGGGEEGYFGTALGAYPPAVLQSLIEQIKTLTAL